MSDGQQIFISYSRRDKEFVKRLVDEFEKIKREIWVDWDDIPLTADWLKEIFKGIEESGTFIFIISPDSVKSKVCGQELEHALSMNKRLVPILYRELDSESQEILHPTLSAHNWIMMLDQSRFDESFQSIIGAIDTDLYHVAQHTRLLVRAREWESKDHNPSSLLRGTDLKEALTWLEAAKKENKRPPLTALHEEYIEFSRRQSRRRRVVTIAIAVYAITIATLFVVAVWQFARAESERRTAEQNAREAVSLSLAGNSLVALSNNNTDLAVAMSMTAAGIDQRRPEIEFSLGQAAYTPGTRFRIAGHTETVTSVEFHPTERVVFTGGWDGDIIAWDLDTGVELYRLSHREVPADQPTHDDVADLEVTDHWIVAGFRSGEIIVWDLETRLEVRRWRAHRDSVNDLAFLPDGQQIISVGCQIPDIKKTVEIGIPICQRSSISIWDVQTGEQLNTFSYNASELLAVAVSPDGTQAAIAWANSPYATSDTGIQIWDLVTGVPVADGNLQGHRDVVTDVEYSQDGQRLVSSSQDGQLILWNTSTGGIVQRFIGHTDWVFSVDFHPGGEQLVSSSADTTIIVWNSDGTMERRMFGHSDWVLEAEFSEDGGSIVSASGNLFLDTRDNQVRVWDAYNGAQIAVLTPPVELAGNIADIDFAPDHDAIISVTTNGKFAVWDLNTSLVTSSWQLENVNLTDVAYHPNGQQVISTAQDGTMTLWNIADGQAVQNYTYETDIPLSFQTVDISPTGQLVAAGGGSGVILMWNVADGTFIREFEGQVGEVRNVEFNQDATRLMSVSGGFSGTVDIWDVSTGNNILRIEGGHSDARLHATFSPDGTKIVSAGYDNRLILWDAVTGAELRRFDGHTGPVNYVSFSPDGRRVISASTDATVRLWDLESGLEIRRFDGHETTVVSALFYPDGERAISASVDGIIRVWNVHSLEQLVRWTEANRYVRELTCNEKFVYRVAQGDECRS